MRFLKAMLCLALVLPALPCRAESEDEIWIEDFMSGRAAAEFGAGMHAWPRERIEFGDLARFVGYSVRISTDGGRARSGVVERADANTVVIRSRLGGGYASYTLRIEQVTLVELVQS
jgi:hypothetical protein